MQPIETWNRGAVETPRHSKHWHWWFLGLCASISAIAVWLIVSGLQPVQRIKASDGTIIELLGVTYGTNHYVPGKPMEKLLALVPEFLMKKFGWNNPGHFRFPNPTLVAWVASPDRSSNSPSLFAAVSNGKEQELQVGTASLRYPGRIFTDGYIITVFPRRSEFFELKLYDFGPNGSRNFLGALKIKNPFFGQRFPEWDAEPLPISKTDGPLQVTLADISVDENQSLKAVLRVADGALPMTGWRHTSVRLSDATGNDLKSNQTTSSGFNETIEVRWLPSLWFDEPSWKVSFEFAPTPFAQSQPSETWTLRNVKIPQGNSPTEINVKTNFNGVDLEVLELAPPNSGVNTFMSGNVGNLVFLKTRAALSNEVQVIAVHAVDDRGRQIRGPRSTMISRRGFDLPMMFPVYADSKTLDITLAIQRNRVFEFIVKPPRGKVEK